MINRRLWLLALLLIPLLSGCGSVSDDITVITVTPDSASLVMGMTQQFTAIGKNEIGDEISFTPSWSTSNTSIGTIEATGLFFANATGEVSVYAASGTVSGEALVTITTGELTSIIVSPDATTMFTRGTQQFTAVGNNSIGGTITITPTWEVSSNIGKIGLNTGFFTSEASGAGTVTARFEGKAGTASVTVNPTSETIVITPEACTYVNSASAATNYGAAIECYVGSSDASAARYRSYIRFNISSIPAIATIESASLTLRVTYITLSGSVDFKVRTMEASWVETTINNSAVSSGEEIASDSISATGDKEITGFGAFVSAWRKGTIANNGIVIKISDTDLSSEYFGFKGRTSADPDQRPRLTVNYTF